MPVFPFDIISESEIFLVKPFVTGKQTPYLWKCISQFLESFQPVLGSDRASPVVSVGQPNDSRAIRSHRGYLTYDTLWAPPSKVVYSSRSAYILSMGGPNGNWSSYPDCASADICFTHQATQKMKSLTLAALVLGSSHWAPWEIEFLTSAVAALIALPRGLQNCRISKDRSHCHLFYFVSVEVIWVTKAKNIHVL